MAWVVSLLGMKSGQKKKKAAGTDVSSDVPRRDVQREGTQDPGTETTMEAPKDEATDKRSGSVDWGQVAAVAGKMSSNKKKKNVGNGGGDRMGRFG